LEGTREPGVTATDDDDGGGGEEEDEDGELGFCVAVEEEVR